MTRKGKILASQQERTEKSGRTRTRVRRRNPHNRAQKKEQKALDVNNTDQFPKLSESETIVSTTPVATSLQTYKQVLQESQRKTLILSSTPFKKQRMLVGISKVRDEFIAPTLPVPKVQERIMRKAPRTSITRTVKDKTFVPLLPVYQAKQTTTRTSYKQKAQRAWIAKLLARRGIHLLVPSYMFNTMAQTDKLTFLKSPSSTNSGILAYRPKNQTSKLPSFTSCSRQLQTQFQNTWLPQTILSC